MTVSDDLSLFGDEDHASSAPTGVTTVENVGHKNNTPAIRLWKLWVTLSHTPVISPTERFTKAVDKSLRSGNTESMLAQLVPLGLYTPRDYKHVADDHRVTRVISYETVRSTARTLRASKSRTYLYGDVDSKVSLDVLWDLCRIDRETLPTLSESEMECATKLTFTRDESWLSERVADIRAQLGRPEATLLPSDVVRGFPRGARGTLNAGRLALEYGKRTTSGTESETLPLDKRAELMLLDGVRYDDVMSFHQRVPQGFWKSVLRSVERGVRLEEAVRRTEEEQEFSLDRDRSV